MTETEWAESYDLNKLLKFLHDTRKDSARKLRLFCVACCRRAWHWFSDERAKRAVEVAERYADGFVTENELSAARLIVPSPASGLGSSYDATWLAAAATASQPPEAERAADCAAMVPMYAEVAHHGNHPQAIAEDAFVVERAAQLMLLRDIFHPFGPAPAVAPSLRAWKDGTLLTVARRIYEKREFEHSPFPADLLQEAGCQDAEILGHLRSEGPHVRGCWALDLILGKA